MFILLLTCSVLKSISVLTEGSAPLCVCQGGQSSMMQQHTHGGKTQVGGGDVQRCASRVLEARVVHTHTWGRQGRVNTPEGKFK